MAYFSQEMKKVLVERLKEDFPEWKFAVKVEDHSSVHVRIKSAPIDLWDNLTVLYNGVDKNAIPKCMNVNEFYLEKQFSGEVLNEMKRLRETINLKGHPKFANFDNSDLQSDYFHVGYYSHMKIGVSLEKPFVYEEPVLRTKKRAKP